MIFGKYQLIELLARGGMAEVYKAKSYGVQGFEKLLVIKKILPFFSDNADFVEMFINEAKIAVSLSHANIVQVFDLGKVDDSYYMAMEYVQGLDLSTATRVLGKVQRQIPFDLAAFIGSEIAKGLDYAHRRRGPDFEPMNIIHRDISPHNILLSHEGEVKITDFGIARAVSTLDSENARSIKGKFAYMAPEQAAGEPQDHRVDIYGAGMVLYECLTGVNPFKGLGINEVAEKAKVGDYSDIREVVPDAQIAPELCDIVAKALAPAANDRYQSAAELYEALISFLYNTGTRVGAHSMAEFLMSSKELLFSQNKGEQEKDAEVLIDENDSEQSQKTPIPFHRSQVTAVPGIQSSQFDKNKLSLSIPLLTETREVSLIGIKSKEKGTAVFSQLGKTLAKVGAEIIERKEDFIVGIFGVPVIDRRNCSNALRGAIKLQKALRNSHRYSSKVKIGFTVYSAGLQVQHDGTVDKNEIYTATIESMEQVAQSAWGEISVEESLASSASGKFSFELEPSSADKQEKLPAKLLEERTAGASYGKLLGRRAELRVVGELFATVSRSNGRVLSITGEPGIGKTRILRDVHRRLLAGGHSVRWYESTCRPWNRTIPFASLGAMIRIILDLDEADTEQKIRSKMKTLRDLGLIPQELDAVSMLLGLPAKRGGKEDDIARQLHSATIRLAQSLASDTLTVLVWDDLDHIDNESLDVLLHLCRSINQSRLLIVLGADSSHRQGVASIPYLTELKMPRLTKEESIHLAQDRMKVEDFPDELVKHIIQNSNGNSLQLEAYVDALLKNGIVSIKSKIVQFDKDAEMAVIPLTLRNAHVARINALPESVRAILQRASVMGPHVDVSILAKVLDVHEDALLSIFQRLENATILANQSNGHYVFESPIARRAIYESIVESKCQDMHLLIAITIEQHFNANEHVEMLADHYQKSGSDEKAAIYLQKSAQKCAAESHYEEAIVYYTHVYQLLLLAKEPDMEKVLAAYLGASSLCLLTCQLHKGIDTTIEAMELIPPAEYTEFFLALALVQMELLVRAGKTEEGKAAEQLLNDILDDTEDNTTRGRIEEVLGLFNASIADMEAAVLHYRNGVDLVDPAIDRNLSIRCGCGLARALASAGLYEEATSIMERLESEIDDSDSLQLQSFFDHAKARVLFADGSVEESAILNVRAYERAVTFNSKLDMALYANKAGHDHAILGDFRKAFSYLNLSQEYASKGEQNSITKSNEIILSFVDAVKFGSNEGVSRLEELMAGATENNAIVEKMQCEYFLGRIYAERGDKEKAQLHFDNCLEQMDGFGYTVYRNPIANF